MTNSMNLSASASANSGADLPASASDPLRDWVPIVVFLSFLLPSEVRFVLGDFTLFAYRLVLYMALPFAFWRMVAQPIRFALGDWAISFAGIWMTIATVQHYGFGVGLVSGGVLSLDMLIAYFVGRIYIRSALQLRRFLYFVAPFVALVGVLIMFESLSHRYVVRPFFGSVFGTDPTSILNRVYEIRLGLLRATGPFLHPISGGLFLGSFVPLFYFADLPRRWFIGLTAGVMGVFTVSSAAIMSIAYGLALIVYDKVRRPFRIGWQPLIWGTIVFLVLIELFTESGLVRIVIRYVALNPDTGYFRQLIWDYGWADVGRQPVYGIGLFESYSRPYWMLTDSVDNLWLSQALRFGVPCLVGSLVCLFANLIKLGTSPGTAERESQQGRPMRTGVAIALVIYSLLLLTVAPWGAESAWYTMLIGVAGGLANPRRGDLPAPAGAGVP